MNSINSDEIYIIDRNLAHALERLCLLLAASSQRDATAEARATATMARALQAAASQTVVADFALPHCCFYNDDFSDPDENLPMRQTDSKIGSSTVENVAAEVAKAASAPLVDSSTAALAASKIMNRNRLEAFVLASPAAGAAFCQHRLLLARSARAQLLISLALGVAAATDAAVAEAAATPTCFSEHESTKSRSSLLAGPVPQAVVSAAAAPLEALLAVGAFVALSVASQGGASKGSTPSSEDQRILQSSEVGKTTTRNPVLEESIDKESVTATTVDGPLKSRPTTSTAEATKATEPTNTTVQQSAIGALRDPRVAGALAAMEDVGASGPRRTLVGHLLLPASSTSAAGEKGSEMESNGSSSTGSSNCSSSSDSSSTSSGSSSSSSSSNSSSNSINGSNVGNGVVCKGNHFDNLALDIAIERDRATHSMPSSSSMSTPGGSKPTSSTHHTSGGRASSSSSPSPPLPSRSAGLKGGTGGAAWTTPGFRLLLTKDRKTLAYVLTEVTIQHRPAASADLELGVCESFLATDSKCKDSSSSGATNSTSSTSNSDRNNSSSNSSDSNSGNEAMVRATSPLKVEWCLRGMQVDPSLRGRGLSKLLLGLWLFLARKCGAGIGPTRRIKKPLVAWALQCWGFEPLCPTAAVQVELASPPPPPLSSSSSSSSEMPAPSPVPNNCDAPLLSSPLDEDLVSSNHQASGTPLSTSGCRKRPREGSGEEEDRECSGHQGSIQSDETSGKERHGDEAPPSSTSACSGEADQSLSKNERKRRAKAEALAANKAAKRARVAKADENEKVAAALAARSPAAAAASSTGAGAPMTPRGPASASAPPPPPPVVLWTPDRARVVSVLSKSELAAQGLCLSPDWPPPPGWARKAVTLNACFALPSNVGDMPPNSSNSSNSSGNNNNNNGNRSNDSRSGGSSLSGQFPAQLQERLTELFVGAAQVTATCNSAPQPLATPPVLGKELLTGGESAEKVTQGEQSNEKECGKQANKPVLMLYAAKLLQSTSPGQWAMH